MPISSLTRKTGLLPGNGVSRDFPFDFKVFQAEDLRVLRTSPNGGETVLSYPSDYTVTLNADQDENPGGNVRVTAAPAAGYSIMIVSAVPETQPVDLQNQGGFYPDVVNQMVDRNTIAIQQLAEQADRSFALPVQYDGQSGGIRVAAPVGGSYLAWNEDGTALINVDPAETTGFAVYGEAVSDVFNADGVETVFELSEDAGSVNNLDVSVSGVVQVAGTDFTWLGGNQIEFTTAPPDGTVVFVRYQRVLPQADIVEAVAAAQAAAQSAEEDRVQTGLDRAATAADRVQTGLDRVATGLDRVATAADRVQTGLDRVATGEDAAAAAANAAAALGVLAPTRSEAAALAIPASVRAIRTSGYADPADGGGALYVRSDGGATSLPARCRFRSVDRFLPDGTVDETNGGYWVLKETAVSLKMVGGVPVPAGVDFWTNDRGLLGAHSTSALQAAMGYIEATPGAYLLVDDYYFFNVCWQITANGVLWQGVGKRRCGVRFAGFSALQPSIDVQALDFTIRDMQICADDRGGSDQSDSGHTGTCLTTGKFFSGTPHAACSATLENLWLTRAAGTRISHSLAVMGRTVGFRARNIEIDGLTGQNHQHGILMHWGCLQGTIGQPVNETYHPVIDNIENVTIRGCQRPGHLSSVTEASINNVYWEGGGGWGVTIGDEGVAFASSEFSGRVLGNISITNATARNINATALGVSSRGTSKFELDETDVYRYRQDEYGVLCFDNWDVQSTDSEAAYHLELGELLAASFSAKNWRTRGVTSSGLSLYINRCNSNIEITGDFTGPGWVRDSFGVIDLDGCSFRPFATVDGLPTTAAGTYALQITGRTVATTLDGNHSAGATTIKLATPLASQHIFKGDMLHVGSQRVYATDIFRAGCTEISVTPLPAAVSNGASVVLDWRTHGVQGIVDLNGGEYGLLADGVSMMRLGGTVRNFGFWGHNIINSVGLFTGVVFENGGLNRIASSSLNTAAVYHGAGSYLTYIGCHYGLNSPYLNRSVRSHSDALGGAHFSCAAGDFITSVLGLAAPTYRAINVDGLVVAATGLPASPATPKAWEPVPKIGTGTPAHTLSGPRVIEMSPDQVKLEASITITDKGAHTGDLTVEGSPFGLTESNSSAICRVTGATGLTGAVMATPNGSGVFLIEQMGPTGVTAVTDANIVNGMQIRFGFIVRRG